MTLAMTLPDVAIGSQPCGLMRWFGLALCALLVACGGGGGEGGSASSRLGPASNEGLPRIEPYERVAPLAWAAPSSFANEPVLRALPLRVSLGPLPAEGPGPRVGGGALPGGVVRIGVARDVASTSDASVTSRLWHWQMLPDGGQVAALTFRSEGAVGLRLALAVGAMPTGAVLSVHASAPRHPTIRGSAAHRLNLREIEDTLARNRRSGAVGAAADTYSTPTVAGEEVTLQVELPAGADPAGVSIAIPRLTHLWWTHAAVTKAADTIYPKSADVCNVDAACEAQYAAEARAVARLEVVSEGTAYLCTGTLLADVGATGTPYFLTAQHCVGNQVEASTVETYWFYRAASCGSAALDPAATYLTGGATLLHAAEASDVSFLRLNGTPPVGAVHAGSLVSLPALNTALAGLHHPAGDFLKLSEGTLSAYGSCQGTLCGANNHTDGNFLVLQWSRGTTEQGSSGSGVFATIGSRRYLVGHLYAGSASCADPSAKDFYGRFDRAFSALRTWLGSPAGS